MGATVAMTDVDSYVDANAGRFVSELKELCSFASIANHGRAALEPCREWLALESFRIVPVLGHVGAQRDENARRLAREADRPWTRASRGADR